MTTEREYRRIPVLYELSGINQDAWSGVIKDGETSDERNIAHHISGEWRTRDGMAYTGQISSAAAATSFHWNCDEAATALPLDDQSGELCSGVSTGTPTRLSVSSDYYVPNSLTTDAIHPAAATSRDAHMRVESPVNYIATSGNIQMYFRTRSNSVTNPTWAANPPAKNAYLLDCERVATSSEFGMYVSTGGNLSFAVASGEVLTDATTDYRHNEWYKIGARWSYLGATTAGDFRLYVDDVQVATSEALLAFPSLGTSMAFLNSYVATSGTVGTSAPCSGNWSILTDEFALLDDVTIKEAVVEPLKVTGIWENTSQDRVIFSAGKRLFYGTGFTEIIATAGQSATIVADTRKSAAEWQGNFYVTTGDTDDGDGIVKLIGSEVKWTDVANSPGGTKYLESYHNHLWAAGMAATPNSVRCSKFDDDDDWTTVSGTTVGQFNLEDTVTGIHPYAGQLIVGTRNTMQAISGYTRADFVKTFITRSVGCISHWSMQSVTLNGNIQVLLWAAHDGIYMMVGGEVHKISKRIQAFWDDLTAGDLDECHAGVNQRRGEYWLAVPDGTSNDNDKVVVYNYEKDAFSIYTHHPRIDVMGQFVEDGTAYFYGGNPYGHVYRLDNGNYDDHKNVGGTTGAYLYTKWYTVDAPDIEKDFRAIWVQYEPTGSYNLNVGHEKDWRESSSNDAIDGEQSIDLSPTSTLWDNFNWDGANWAGNEATKIEEIHLEDGNARARALRFRLRCDPTATGPKMVVRGLVQVWGPIQELPA